MIIMKLIGILILAYFVMNAPTIFRVARTLHKGVKEDGETEHFWIRLLQKVTGYHFDDGTCFVQSGGLWPPEGRDRGKCGFFQRRREIP